MTARRKPRPAPKTHQICVRVPEDEYVDLSRLATAQGMTVPDLARIGLTLVQMTEAVRGRD